MVFRFNLEKTIQAIAALLHFHGSTEMSYFGCLSSFISLTARA